MVERKEDTEKRRERENGNERGQERENFTSYLSKHLFNKFILTALSS